MKSSTCGLPLPIVSQTEPHTYFPSITYHKTNHRMVGNRQLIFSPRFRNVLPAVLHRMKTIQTKQGFNDLPIQAFVYESTVSAGTRESRYHA